VEIADDDLPGALVLGVAATRPSRSQLLDEALRDESLLKAAGLGRQVVEHLHALVGSDYEQEAALALGTRLTDQDTAEHAAESLARLSPGDASRVARLATEVIEEELLPEEEEDQEARDELVTAYGRTIEGLEADEATLRALGLPLLRLNTQTGRNAFERLLPRLGQSSDQAFIDELLKAAVLRRQQAVWLDAVDWSADVDVAAHLRKLTRTLWSRGIEEGHDASTHDANRRAIARAVEQSGSDLTRTEDLPGELTKLTVPTDEETAKAAARLLAVAHEFIDVDLLGRRALADALQSTVLAWIRSQPPTSNQQQIDAIRSRLRTQAPYLRQFVAFVTDTPEATDTVVVALTDECLADEDIRAWLAIHALAGAPDRSVTDVVGSAEVASALRANGTAAHEMLADWINLGLPTAEQLQALDGLAVLRGPRVGAVADALRRWSTSVDSAEVASLVGWVAADTSVAAWVYQACEPASADPETLTALLVEAWTSTTNNPGRERVLDVWLWAKYVLAEYQKPLIQSVFLDCLAIAADNNQAASMAPRYADLVSRPPYGTLTRLRDSLRPLVSGKSGKSIRSAYEQAGVLEPKKRKKRGGFFGRSGS
jgi:hypothetical protein